MKGFRGSLRQPFRPAFRVGDDRILASATAGSGEVVGGSRDALLILPGEGADPGQSGEPTRIPWEEIEAADWDRDESVLKVSEVGRWGEPRVEHVFTFDEPGRLLELVRERVTASVLLQRHVAVEGRRGLRVIARRAPSGDRPIAWFYEYDEGVDPDDPAVRAAAQEALSTMRGEVGAP